MATRDLNGEGLLRESEQAAGLLAAIVDCSDDAIISKNLDGVITSWNHSAERLFGYTAPEAIGRHITIIIPPERLDEETEILARLRRGERIDHFETVRVAKGGKQLDLSLTISPIKDSSGRIIGASKVARDITERKRAERRIARFGRQQQLLYELADRLHRAEGSQALYDAALHAITSALGCSRAAILLDGDSGTMRFVAWRGLSHDYRHVVDGRSPWRADDADPQPICISSIETANLTMELKAALRAEGIASLAFIPLVSSGKLVGKLTVYFDASHELGPEDIGLSVTIARQLAFGVETHHAEEALRVSESRFRLAEAAAQMGTWEWDLTTGRATLSPELHRMFGIDPNNPDHTAQWTARVFPPDQKTVQQCIDEGRHSGTMDFQYRYNHPDLDRRWFHCKGSRVGNESRMVGVVVDITERKLGDEALQQSRAQLASEAAALAKLNDWSSRLWKIRRLEDGLQEMLSALIELLGADRADIQLLDAERGVLVVAAQRGWGPDLLHFFREESHGDLAPARALHVGRTVVIEDVEKDSAYVPLRPSAESAGFRALISAPMIGGDGTPLGVVSTYFARKHQPTGYELHRLSLYVRQAADFIQRCKADDELRQARQRLEAALRASDEATARERVLRSQAETASRLKDEFLATVSHELRTPLNAILGWASMLHGGLSSEQSLFPRAFEAIERNAKAQAQIVEDLLDVSRIISGKLMLDVKEVRLGLVIQAAMDAVRPAANAKNIHLRLRLERSADILMADEARLQQVIWNLLSNSVKFTPPGGSVEVAARGEDRTIEISVSDTGEGVKPEFLPYVFDRFRQADASTARKHAGLGLGLAIVRHLTEMHGGTVDAESAGEGKGARFRVRLPVHAVSQTANLQARSSGTNGSTAESAGPAHAALSGIRILAVDDSQDTRELLRFILSENGADVITASSAREALETLQLWHPDILISDIGMPGEDGYSLLEKVRVFERESGGNMPAVALTGYARQQDRTRALQAGYQVFIAKPIDPSELVRHIAELAATHNRPVAMPSSAEGDGL